MSLSKVEVAGKLERWMAAPVPGRGSMFLVFAPLHFQMNLHLTEIALLMWAFLLSFIVMNKRDYRIVSFWIFIRQNQFLKNINLCW